MSYRDKKYEFMIVTVDEDGIAIIQHNRPDALNAIHAPLNLEKNEIYKEVIADPGVKVVITTGNDRAFCAGGDLKAFANYGVKDARLFIDRSRESSFLLQNMAKPTIAMVAGICMGGGLENVLAHDLKIAADNAKFALPEINVGIFPGAGATQRLPQLMSLSKAKELVFLGETFDAQTALDLGIVNKVVPLADLKEETMKLARKLASKPLFSLRLAKEALNAAWNCSADQGTIIETHGWSMCYGTKDQKEGMQAFIEKRKPVFKGE
ncbi:MAG: enoyl-CoA hydratase/isomerase family protein [Syntrophomonadaceae bacterium]|jgi:enoyl-CoA hydratase/carnithine racemase|nr:enoyl-CoA hydratase/isomerase family protein [Syntrophomonadaceae bacterium]